MASVVEITPKFGLKPEKKGPSTGTLVGAVAVGALVGCAATIGVSYPTLKAQWDKDDAAVSDPNPCQGAKPAKGAGFDNHQCIVSGVTKAVEQAGGNVTLGYDQGGHSSTATPVTTTLAEAGMCPVNVHWHLGAEHLSVGEYDIAHNDDTYGPSSAKYDARQPASGRKLLAGGTNYLGGRCKHYKDSGLSAAQKTDYDFKYCKKMKVGETYEVHWPHSEMGACNTKWQYQLPFYDGVLCRLGKESYPGKGKYGLGKVGDTADPVGLAGQIGVQAQVFTVVNDEAYYYPDLFSGMIVAGEYGEDLAIYTGSTTGTTRNNDDSCSKYSPITWQVDRKCHLISASSFDKMCADMMRQRDNMSGDLYAHGSREVVAADLVANNKVNLKAAYAHGGNNA